MTDTNLRTVENALDVLELVAISTQPISVTELARKLGRSRGTMYRLVKTLEGRGYLVRDPLTHRYQFGPKALEMVGSASEYAIPVESLFPRLQWLGEKTGETAFAAVLKGQAVVVVYEIIGSRSVVVKTAVGRVLPLHASAPGLALLASRSDEFAASYLRGKLSSFTSQTCTDPRALWARIRRIRSIGAATNMGEYRVGVGGVSAVLPSFPTGGAVTIGVCFPVERMTAMLMDAVLGAARATDQAIQSWRFEQAGDTVKSGHQAVVLSSGDRF